MAPALVIFDLDGTLVDTRADLAASTNAALDAVGLPRRAPEAIATMVGRGTRRLIEQAVGSEHQGRTDDALAAFMVHYEAHLLGSTAPYPGIRELLDALPGPMTVCTNKVGRFARRILEGLGLLHRFGLVLGGDEMPQVKPDPAGALAQCAWAHVDPAAARFVGDSRIDVLTARGAGIPFVGVTWGYGGRLELAEAGAEQCLDDVASLERILRGG